MYFAKFFLYFANFVNEKTTSTYTGFFFTNIEGKQEWKAFQSTGLRDYDDCLMTSDNYFFIQDNMGISFCWLKFLYFAKLLLYLANFVIEKTTSTHFFYKYWEEKRMKSLSVKRAARLWWLSDDSWFIRDSYLNS